MPAKSSPPQPAATALVFDLPPLPPERVELPPPFAGQWVELRLDVPQKEVVAADGDVGLLAVGIAAWSLTADGQPVPVTRDALVALVEQMPPLFVWLRDEWVRRRWSPLAVPPTASNGSS